jgi:cytochrome c-type biogenesis protein CcmH/NrfG
VTLSSLTNVQVAPHGAVDAGFARHAETLHARGDSADAHRLLTAGVRRFPGDVTALLVLARVCHESGRADEARDWIDAALRLDPGCPAALLHKADAHASWPHADTAAVRQTPPESAAAKPVGPTPTTPHTLARSTPSAFAFPVRDEDEEPEIEENSAPHIATVTLAEIYLQQGLKEQAAQIYRQLLERQPEDDSVRKRLHEILREIEGS